MFWKREKSKTKLGVIETLKYNNPLTIKKRANMEAALFLIENGMRREGINLLNKLT